MSASAPETGESTASINRRCDERSWPGVQEALAGGAVLQRVAPLPGYYTRGHRDDRFNGRGVSAAMVRRQERAGALLRVGVDTYDLASKHQEKAP